MTVDWGAVAQGTAAAGGGLVGGIYSPAMGHQWAAAASQHQMAFERWMSNTAYSRAVRDLRRAGLNPALAYTQGGASTPNVGQAVTPDPGMDIGGAIGAGLSTARAAREANLNMKVLGEALSQAKERSKQEVSNTERAHHAVFTEAHRASLMEEEALLARASRGRTEAETGRARAETALTDVERQVRAALLPHAQAVAEFDRSALGRAAAKTGRALEPIGGAALPALVGGGVGAAVGRAIRKGSRSHRLNKALKQMREGRREVR